jgi:predicted transcriptional regulator
MKVLLSIKPEYTEKIFSGVKKYEFRRQKPRSIIERVFIYECSPSKNIVGWFTIKRILSGSPEKIWDICRSLSGIKKRKFFTYCNGKKVIYALEIDRVFQFKTPINPFEICSDFRPPQNFSYLDRLSIFNAIELGEDDYR